MQTKHQIQELLVSANVRPDRRLGQHFLIDLNLMRLLIRTADIQEDDVVLEVGSGTGSLTEAIAENAGRCVTVEVDSILAGIARQRLEGVTNVELICADVLQDKLTINPAVVEAIKRARESCAGRLLLVSNLPYSAATPLMLNLVMGPVTAAAMYVTVQKEVAERMTAVCGTKDYGILSILLSATGRTKLLRTLKPTVFWPQPQVHSAMVCFTRDEDKLARVKNLELLSRIVNGFMQHRRKMLGGCIRYVTDKLGEILNWQEILTRCSVDIQARPDDVTPEQYIAIANVCSEQYKENP
jgi:16S rRNA (adenine1518-N6/adenine1519-N6)-dimethyltransferase